MRPLLVCVLALILQSTFGQSQVRKSIQSRLIMAENGDTIRLEEGIFEMDATLSMEGKQDIVIQGRGMDRTVLSFKGQTAGAEGIRISNCHRITMEDMTIRDAKGDGIKTMHVDGMTFRRVRSDWSGKPSSRNGAYAIYPVSCRNVLIEYCIARGASDAGIYVGQSRDIIVRHNTAFENVAGIEIENSLNADVYGNKSFHNTGGILVFDLPDLEVKKGGFCRVHDNEVRENNLRNFAPKGNIVGKVPQGTGILLLACNNTEVFNNEIINNRTLGVGIISYFITENKILDTAYYPYPLSIHIHDNTFSRKHQRATMHGRMGKLYRFKLKFGKDVPDIVFDGVPDEKLAPNAAQYGQDARICIRNNKGATFADLDAANDFRNISRDPKPYDCERQSLKLPRQW